MNPYGQFLNPNGYTDVEGRWVRKYPFSWGPLREMQYVFALDLAFPLTLITPDGETRIQPDKRFDTNWGSTGPAFRLAPPQEYVVYPFHDCIFRVGGLWHSELRADGTWGPWRFVPYTLSEANHLLRNGILAEGATVARANLIFAVVSAGSWIPWMQARAVREEARARKMIETARAIALDPVG